MRVRTILLTIAALMAGPQTGTSADRVDYADCILENMRGVKSDRAALLIEEACDMKFPEAIIAPACRDGRAFCKPWERDWASGEKVAIGSVVTSSGEVLPPLPDGAILEDPAPGTCTESVDDAGGREQPSRWECQ